MRLTAHLGPALPIAGLPLAPLGATYCLRLCRWSRVSTPSSATSLQHQHQPQKSLLMSLLWLVMVLLGTWACSAWFCACSSA